MRLLGAEVEPVEFGTRTLKEATSEAIRDWISNVETTYYLIGSCVGPHPYPGDRAPLAVRHRARGATAGARHRRTAAGRRRRLCGRRLERDRALRRVRRRRDVRARRRRGCGRGEPRERPCGRAPRVAVVGARRRGRPDRSTRTRSRPVSTIPGVGPEHAFLRDSGRAEYVTATDEEALAAFHRLARDRRHPARRSSLLTRSLAHSTSMRRSCSSGFQDAGDKDLGEVLAH